MLEDFGVLMARVVLFLKLPAPDLDGKNVRTAPVRIVALSAALAEERQGIWPGSLPAGGED
jgi:hypothetical protein